MGKRILMMFASFLVLVSLNARANLVVEVTQGNETLTPVAVSPFGWSGDFALAEDIAGVVSNDLAHSGFFESMDRANMLSYPTQSSQIFYRDWRVSKMDYLVIGRVTHKGGNQLEVVFELFDVLREKRLLSEVIPAKRSNLRDVAHYISDKVFERLTGIKGAFSTRIAYVTAQQQNAGQTRYKLQIADADGARPRTVLESREPILSPAWSSDAQKLAYVSFETTRPAIYIQHLRTGKREKIQSFSGLNGAPAWSPDGSRLALTLSKDGNPEIYVLDLNSRRLSRITRHYGIDTEPTWGADGRSIYFTSDRGGQPQIYKADLAQLKVSRVTFEGNYNGSPKLTPDGRFMVMVHRSSGAGGSFNIAVLDMQTDRFDIVSRTYLDESPSIAPNGSVVIYATQRNQKGVLAAVTLDGRVKYEMPFDAGDVREPAWSPYLH